MAGNVTIDVQNIEWMALLYHVLHGSQMPKVKYNQWVQYSTALCDSGTSSASVLAYFQQSEGQNAKRAGHGIEKEAGRLLVWLPTKNFSTWIIPERVRKGLVYF